MAGAQMESARLERASAEAQARTPLPVRYFAHTPCVFLQGGVCISLQGTHTPLPVRSAVDTQCASYREVGWLPYPQAGRLSAEMSQALAMAQGDADKRLVSERALLPSDRASERLF